MASLLPAFGLVDHPGVRKIHESPIPLAGGWAIGTAFFGPLILGLLAHGVGLLPGDMAERLAEGWGRRAFSLVVILAGAAGMLALGFLDDRYELSPAWKFGGQLVIATLVAAGGVRITLFVANPFFSYGMTILWIVTVTNAFNFVDNMNGLCAGLSAIAGGLLGGLAASHEQYLVAAFCFLVAGGALGFLPYNYPGATAFLGDAGSHFLGYLVAVAAILPHFHSPAHPHPWAVLSPLLILALPLADLAWVVVFRVVSGRRFYVGDTNHLSHQLVRAGLRPSVAVGVLWLLAALIGSVALAFWW